MVLVIVSLLYGVVAGAFIPVGAFAAGLAVLLAVAVYASFAASWLEIAVTAAAVLAFAQIGYFTTVYYRTIAVARRRAEGERRPREDAASLGEASRLARPTTED